MENFTRGINRIITLSNFLWIF